MISFRIHSSQHLEMKSLYPVPTKKSCHRDLHYYFFTPSQLNINKQCIDLSKLGMKLTSHARYSSPSFSILELLDLNNTISPLTILRDFVDNKKNGSVSSLIHETQNLANAYRHESKKTLSLLKKCFEDKKKNTDYNLVKELTVRWYTNTNELFMVYRELLKKIDERFSPDNLIRIAFHWADEYMSLSAEKDGLEIYFLLEPDYSTFNILMSQIMKVVRTESSHRQEMNYETGDNSSSNNSEEKYTYRKSSLKKWAQSVLYLIPKQSKAPQRINFILAALAAGVAMAFAIMTALYATLNLTENTMSWALFMIMAYVFKDRIKEGLKAVINVVLPKLMADRIFIYRSPRSERILCRTRQKINIVSSEKVPSTIRNIRKDDNNPFRKMMPPEDVVHFSNYYKFFRFKKKVEKETPWVEQLAIITRLRMDDWLKEMDDTPSEVFGTEEENEETNKLVAQRIYHIHLVVEDHYESNNTSVYYHYLIVAKKDGIVRIEELPSDFNK